MNKTYNMNLGGMPFQIDDEAFERLNAYLNAVKRKFSHVQGHNEIVEDIEARMAEMFHENLEKSSRKIVSSKDVDAAIETMGRPEEFEQGFEEERSEYNARSTYKVGKKLYRDPDDKVLGGVISGLSQYFGFESPTWMRIIWAALPILDIMFAGISTTLVILTYVVLWIAVPRAKTATQKMQMRGEKVNLDSIEKTFSEGIEGVKKNFNSDRSRSIGSGLGDVLAAIAIGFGKLLLAFGLFIAGLIALSLIIAFFAGIIGVGASAPFLSNHIFGNSWMSWVGVIGLLLLCFAPLVFLITLLVKLLFKSKINMPAVLFGTLGAFILGLVLTSYTGVSLVKDFSEESSAKEIIELAPASEIYLYGNDIEGDRGNGDFQIGVNDRFLKQNVDLHILPSKDSVASLEIRKYAKGKNKEAALDRANKIQYNFVADGDRLTFDEELAFNKNELWRAQEVDAYLRIPQNTILHFDESVIEVLRNAKMHGEYYSDWNLVNKGTWKYMENQLVPLDSEGNPLPDEEENVEGKIQIDEDSENVNVNLFGKDVLQLDVVEHENGEPKRINVRIGDRKTIEVQLDEGGEVIDIDEQ